MNREKAAHSDRQDHEAHNTHMARTRQSRSIGILMLFSAYSLAFLAGYGVTTLLYRYLGLPHEMLRHLFSGLAAIAIILLAWRLILQFGGDSRLDQRDVHDQLTQALAEIAKGNFDVLLDPKNIGFYKVDKARDRSLGGNGLGLSIVKTILELHGGTVALESEAGKGAVFIVRIP